MSKIDDAIKKLGLASGVLPKEIENELLQFIDAEIAQAQQEQYLEEEHKLDEIPGFVFLNTEINRDTASQLIAQLMSYELDDRIKEPVHLYINCPGGCLHSGFGIIDVIKSMKKKVRTIVLGEAMSMGGFIFFAGTDERIVSPNSICMIHEFSSWSGGTYSDLFADRKGQDMFHKKIVNFLYENSNLLSKEEVISKLMPGRDNYLDAEELIKFGLADRVLTPAHIREKKVPAKTSRKSRKKVVSDK